MNVVTVSGGLTSAFVADLVLKEIDENATLIFTDVKWEHPDLYRFLDDLEKRWGREILRLEDGRTPEELFYQQGILGSNRVPICSRILKAKVLQDWLKGQEDVTLFFGIDVSEYQRKPRIENIYNRLGVAVRFPLIENNIYMMKEEYLLTIEEWGIPAPVMYRQGFKHNNCHGGCVRQGKRGWITCLQVYPEIYAERERLEQEFKGGKYTYLKDKSLKQLREEYEAGVLEQSELFDRSSCACFEVSV